MAAVEEIGTLLQSLQALKAPGVTQSKVKEISQKAVDNIQVGDSPRTHRHCTLAALPSDTQYKVRPSRMPSLYQRMKSAACATVLYISGQHRERVESRVHFIQVLQARYCSPSFLSQNFC